MKIGIYSPYLDTVGGGEKYMLTIAQGLSSENNVDVFLDTHLQTLDIKTISEKITKLLNLDLSKINFINAPFGKGTRILERVKFLKRYDLFFYLTDGSIFYSSAKASILHIQSPIKAPNSGIWNRFKQSSWNLIIYNSNFTKINSEKFWKIKSEVVYPPVDVEMFKSGKKKKQILSVGRLFGYSKNGQTSLMLAGKRQGLEIEEFKKLVDSKKVDGWSFYIVGGAQEGDMEYIEELKKKSEGYPIFIQPNLEFKKLLELYSESSIYWHAYGFEETDPTKMEHFGIATVEAMAAGCIPVVINAGGQKEIVDDGKNGFLWNDLDELQNQTLKLMNDQNLRESLSKFAQEKSQQFSKDKFIENINSLVKKYADS